MNTITNIRAGRVLVALLLLLAAFGAGSMAPAAKTAGTAAAAAGDVCQGKTLVMGTSPDYPPYENTDAKNGGAIIGLDIDIAKSIAAKLGCKLDIAGMDFNGLIAALQTGRVDFVMSGMSVTEERKKSVDFSDTYYVARNTIVSAKENAYQSLAQLAGKRVGAQLGSTQESVAAAIDGAAVKKLNKVTDLIQEIKSNRIDAAIIEDAVALDNIEANPDLSFAMLPAGAAEEGYAIAFPKGSSLTPAFNEALKDMDASGEKQRIIDAWFGKHDAVPAKPGLIDFSSLDGYTGFILRGTLVTLLFTLVSALLGFIWGTILSLFKLSTVKPLQWFATVYTSVFRGTPLLLQLVLIYYATPQLTGYDIPALLAAGLAFGLNSAAYLSETIRGGIMAVDRGQREAAMALGIPYRTMMVSIIFPQAVKNILPALVNECVALIKESSLVSVIGVADLLRRASEVQAATYRAFESLLFVGAIYYVLVLVLTSLARLLERRLRRSD
ncbi:polar amino acid transport system substrate-binding protein [Paenibacillus sp. UNC496MF]|uniref:ABC transporter substrate-binding protein/permease n=1 Tax=Paenibacillus sp. UNC496MF TaxID=1502753 RepID=UPI0008E9884E|nr:ABC transporter substrate-binding protein/permease [Paenibacillus sp. UNC496MF]SFI36116.1 polar amino acid transport system substrate-binding protein [Paenibacillus sp. UNC496MF]